jgi:hypothetical protein
MPLRLQLLSEHDALNAAGHKLAIAAPYQLGKTVFTNPEPLFTIATTGHPYGGRWISASCKI